MIKGVSKQVVICNDCKDTIFEQVIFILKPEAVAAGVDHKDMQSEAHRILEQSAKFDTKVLSAQARAPVKAVPSLPRHEQKEHESAVGVWVVWAIILGLAGIAALITSFIV